jgi:tetratricopeptide (TPR) repeat protein
MPSSEAYAMSVDELTTPPDPMEAACPADFVHRLNSLRRWAGHPSLRELRALAGTSTRLDGSQGPALPLSSTSALLNGRGLPRLPRMAYVEAFVTACLRARHHAPADIDAAVHRWLEAWRYLAAAGETITPAPAPDGGPADRQKACIPWCTPRQLPAHFPRFVGRVEELRQISAALGDCNVLVISGLAGVGKTALAMEWARHTTERYPDGQLYVDLRGFSPAESPVRPETAIRGFLITLGVPPDAIPVDADTRAALYRTLVADKRILVVLDNAFDTAQISSLLPGVPTCTAVITSRNHLGGLVAQGARSLALDVLNHAEAHELFGRHLGSGRMAGEPDAVRELVNWCQGLPLAIAIAAARIVTQPTLTLAALAEELRERSTRLDALDAGELSGNLRAVFSWSYRALPAAAATAFRLLGLAPGTDIGLSAVSSLTQTTRAQAHGILRTLEIAHLVEEHRPGRYRMHDLLRLYAAEQGHDEPDAIRLAASRRLVGYYASTAYAADRLLEPHRPPVEPTAGCHPDPLPDQTAALAWFDTEHPNLLAAHRLALDLGWHSTVWQLAWALTTYHTWRGLGEAELSTWQCTLDSVGHLDDPAISIRAHRRIGGALTRVGRHADALDHLQRAIELAERVKDLPAQAHTHRALACAYGQRSQNRQALQHAMRALHLYQAMDDPVWAARALNAVGWYSARLGRHSQARIYCEAALALFRRHDDPDGEADTLDSLGFLTHQCGRHGDALGYYQQALTRYTELGNTHDQADTLDRLGQTHAALDNHASARRSWQQALGMYQAQHRPEDIQRIRDQLRHLAG